MKTQNDTPTAQHTAWISTPVTDANSFLVQVENDPPAWDRVVSEDVSADLETRASALLAALVSAMTYIPNPDDVEDSRVDSLDEYHKFWTRAMHTAARAAIARATNAEGAK
jgi:hypothetical protein